MAYDSRNLLNYFRLLPDKRFLFGGGTWRGLTVARMMQNKTAHDELSSVITRRLVKFPLPAFRPLYLKSAYLWYGWQDGR
jgi:hypothetical protein